MAEHSTRTVVVEVKYVSSTSLVAHTENCKLDIPLNCSVKELDKTLIGCVELRTLGLGFRQKIGLEMGFGQNFGWEMGFVTPPSGPSFKNCNCSLLKLSGCSNSILKITHGTKPVEKLNIASLGLQHTQAGSYPGSK